MFNAVDNAGVFLIQTLFNLYLIVVMLRLFLQGFGADYYNPVSQFILKLTNPVITPLRKIIPAIQGIDLATLCVLIVLQLLKLTLIIGLKLGILPHIGGLLIWSIGDLLQLALNIFFYAVLLVVILSWVAPTAHSPISAILHLITAPLLLPARRIIPPIAGFDISPIPVLILIKLTEIVFAETLIAIGLKLAVPVTVN